jgi:hypothetical protein
VSGERGSLQVLHTLNLPQDLIDRIYIEAERQSIAVDSLVTRLIGAGLRRYEEGVPWRLTKYEDAWKAAQA